MKILIAYGTNSGGTLFAGEYIKELLTDEGHEVTLEEVKRVSISDIGRYDLVIFGTNTWFYRGQEGQPHLWYDTFLDQFPKNNFSDSKFAIYALGDSSYAQFCHSAGHLENMVQQGKGTIIADSLKIDGYYRDEEHSQDIIRFWVGKLSLALQA